MSVNWHGVRSSTKSLPGGGPQGSSLGLWSFLSQTNDNPEDNSEENMFKFVDDKTTLEVINLLSIGMASQNIKVRVPSNVLTSNLVISNDNLKTQEHLQRISEWTRKKQMKLNVAKTKNIIFNFSKNNQFTTELKLDGKVVETVNETKLLGTVITDKLDWNSNTEKIIKESNKRMVFLHRSSKFTCNKSDLKKIYIQQIRSKLEQSAVVWHSSLTQKCKNKLERVQKSALRIILGEHYLNYKNALKVLNLQSLEERRETLCLKFAKKCLQVQKFRSMFPVKHQVHNMPKRGNDKYVIRRALTERHKNSAIPYMQRLLNKVETEKRKICKQIDQFVPVNSRSFNLYH